MRRLLRQIVAMLLLGVLVFGMGFAYRWYAVRDRGGDAVGSNQLIYRWLTDAGVHESWGIIGGVRCGTAPFILPSSGFIGLLWRDPAPPYSDGRRHTGIDIFGLGAPNTVPIVAVYEGWLTRESDWKSTVIIRHDDPLQPGRTIWTYYTHMANRAGNVSFIAPNFPAGTTNLFVKQGTLLGYQGEYAGSGNPIAMHVHMSIVTSDSVGDYLNEAILANTLDPSPYFGLPLSIDANPKRPILCS
jgi:hypothetical protein